jgi:hypothetical protein
MGAPGSTRGSIACGKTRCKAPGKACIWSEEAFAWTCVARSIAPTLDNLEPGIFCDDGTDCPQGQACCKLWVLRGNLNASCVPRPQVDGCLEELCLEGGAPCSPGRTCISLRPDEPGVCEAEKGPATCAGQKRCPASAPLCAKTTAGLACVAKGTAAFDAAIRRWQCTRQQDCHAGDRCVATVGEDELRSYCVKYSPADMGPLICRPGESLCGGDAKCRAEYACAPVEDGPPWMGVWGVKN